MPLSLRNWFRFAFPVFVPVDQDDLCRKCGKMLSGVAVFHVIVPFFLCFPAVLSYYFNDNQPTYLTGAVGDYVIFNCEIDFPQEIPIPYKLIWRKGVR